MSAISPMRMMHNDTSGVSTNVSVPRLSETIDFFPKKFLQLLIALLSGELKNVISLARRRAEYSWASKLFRFDFGLIVSISYGTDFTHQVWCYCYWAPKSSSVFRKAYIYPKYFLLGYSEIRGRNYYVSTITLCTVWHLEISPSRHYPDWGARCCKNHTSS